MVSMKVGDLVRVNQNIDEYTAVLGKSVGVLIGSYDPKTEPLLFEVLWSNGETEQLYTDEMELINEKR